MALPSCDDEILLLHNPRCSKSRATKALLDERGTTYRLRLYLEDPLTQEELVELAKRLGKPVGEWTRKKEAAFQDAGLGPDSGEGEILAAVVHHPILMERPVLVRGGRARIGRPPEAVLELL